MKLDLETTEIFFFYFGLLQITTENREKGFWWEFGYIG